MNYLAQISIDAEKNGIRNFFATDQIFNNIIGLVYAAIGAVALFYIVRGALLFVTSGSDPSSVKDARETILYAVVALIGSTVVFGVLQFVVNRVG